MPTKIELKCINLQSADLGLTDELSAKGDSIGKFVRFM